MLDFSLQRLEIRLGDVADINEIARLSSITENIHSFARRKFLCENTHDAAFAAVPLTFAINIGITEYYRL